VNSKGKKRKNTNNMNIYNARLCSKMAGFIVDAALISSYKIFPKSSTITTEILHEVVQNLKPLLLKSCFSNVVNPGFLCTIAAKASWLNF
jgi:hypothetical protein